MRLPNGAPSSGALDPAGFIDIQAHSWDALLWRDGRVVSKVTQGVTSEILGEATLPRRPTTTSKRSSR